MPNPKLISVNAKPLEIGVDYAPEPSFTVEVYRIMYKIHAPPPIGAGLHDYLLAAKYGLDLPPYKYTFKDCHGLDFLLGEFPRLKKYIEPRMLQEQFDRIVRLMYIHVEPRADLRLQRSFEFEGWLLYRKVEE